MKPYIIKDFLSDKQHKDLKIFYSTKDYNIEEDYDTRLGRFVSFDKIIDDLGKDNIKKAKDIFDTFDITFSSAMYLKYIAPQGRLPEHLDLKACTYTINYCLDQTSPWGIWVDGEEFILNENEALVYLGNDQMHGRKEMQFNEGHTSVILWFYVPQDHWVFSCNGDIPEEVMNEYESKRQGREW
jgi:hypothetical protein